MTDGEITQELPDLTNKYRYRVRPIGERIVPGSIPGVGLPSPREYGSEVFDSWTGDVMTVHWAGSPDLAALVAETQASERNAPAVALEFASKLALFTTRARSERMPAGEILEDVDTILEWHLGMLRGVKTEPLNMTALYVQAPEFNR
jgi:hypothetical protein